MKTFIYMIVKQFTSILLFSLIFFVLILELVDLFSNLWRYLHYDVSLKDILTVALLYLPKCVSYSLPISLLFSVSFTLGTLYGHNELIAVFGAGVSLFRFVLPILFSGILLSGFWFYFEEAVVIDTFREKNNLSRELLKQRRSLSNANVTVLSQDRSIIYQADYYNDNSKTLSGLTVINFNSDSAIDTIIYAEWAKWASGIWELHETRIFSLPSNGFITEKKERVHKVEYLNEPPSTFRKTERNVEEMTMEDASQWITTLKRAGLDYRGALTDYYKRFSFALTPFLVTLLSSAIGGKLKKNILLMSLLISLIISVLYYVFQMVFILIAKLGYIPPLMGAWLPFILFLIPSSMLFRYART